MEVDSKFPSSEDRDLPERNLFVPRKLQPELGRSGEVGVLRKPVGLRSGRSLDGSHGNEADSGQHCQVNRGLKVYPFLIRLFYIFNFWLAFNFWLFFNFWLLFNFWLSVNFWFSFNFWFLFNFWLLFEFRLFNIALDKRNLKKTD